VVWVVGIDPGCEETTYAELIGGEIGRWGKVKNTTLLELIPLWQSALLVFEGLQCYGMPVGETTFQTAIWLGRFIQQACNAKIKWQLVKRTDVKRHLCGAKAKLKDKDVRQALIQKYGPPGTKQNPGNTYGISNDVWSALGIADYGMTLLTILPAESLAQSKKEHHPSHIKM